jgi:hypothetical protein
MKQQPDDFDVDALHAALDAERQSRGLSWQGLAREVSKPFEGTTSRPISASKLSGMRSKRATEGDGALQALRWMNRTPEDFVPDRNGIASGEGALPSVSPNRVLRFDARAIHSALDVRRRERELTWAQVATEIGGFTTVNTLTHLAKGGRVGFPHVMRVFRWLGRPAAGFTRITFR